MLYDRLVAIISLFVSLIPLIPIANIRMPPYWLILKVFAIYITGILSTFLMIFIAKRKFNDNLFSFIRILLFFLIPLTTSVLLYYQVSYCTLSTAQSVHMESKLFFQAHELGPCLIRTYATNGKCIFTFHDKKSAMGPDGHAIIEMQCFGTTIDQNCGWVYFFTKGVDISKFKELRFSIRGARGREKVKVKAKDAEGREEGVDLDQYVQPTGYISTEWQYAMIPLDQFGGVKFDFFDNFSLATDGSLAGKTTQIIYVGGFQLRPR